MSFLDDDPTPKKGDQHAISCRISGAENQGKGRGQYTDYLVTTQFANASESLVRRSWEDFEWIQDRLVQERAGIIVPVLPVKKAANRRAEFEPQFLSEREKILDRFIQRIVKHQELVEAPSLLPFFTSSPKDWEVLRTAAKSTDTGDVEASNHTSVNDTNEEEFQTVVISATTEAVPQKKKGLLGQWWSAKRDQMALRSKNLVLEETPVESKRFEDMQQYADHLETCIRILAEDSKALSEPQKAISERFKTMGAAFSNLWGEHELSNTGSSTMYQTMGDAWANLAKQLHQQHEFTQEHLTFSLDELVLDIIALKEAIAKRKKIVYEYTKLVQEGRKMQQRMDAMRSQVDMNNATDVYYSLEQEIRNHDVTAEDRKKLKDLITERLTRDIERFRIEWHERMREVMELFHSTQIQMLLGQQDLWKTPLPALKNVEQNRAALPTGAKKAIAPEIAVSYTSSGASVAFINRDKEHSTEDVFFQTPEGDVTPVRKDTGNFSAFSSSFDSVTLTEVDESLPMGVAPPVSVPPPPPVSPPPMPPSESQESNKSEPAIASI